MSFKKNRIAIITTVYNFNLYNQTIKFFPCGIKIFKINGTKGFFGIESMLFFIERLKSKKFDWIIMADEDVVFKNPENVFDLINFMEENNYITCGMRDGGTLGWRNKNPYAINTFFSVLNLKKLYPIYNKKEILSNQYFNDKEDLGSLDKLNTTNYEINSLYEPYYCFYFWLLRKNKKILYLNAVSPTKDESTLVFDHQGRELLYHAWYARLYNLDLYHTTRINKLLQLGRINEKVGKPISLRNPFFSYKKVFYKYFQWLRNI